LNGCSVKWESVAQDAVVGGILGKLIPGARMSGITAGRGNANAIYRQMVTKFETGQISKVTAGTLLLIMRDWVSLLQYGYS